MDCPKCTGTMLIRTFGHDIKIHRCNRCAGIWAQPEAIDKMKSQWMAEAVLDVGDPDIGSSLNQIDNINCPEGHGLMSKTEDPKQYHIWYEACSTCGGMFLDAGEFTDLKFETLMDRFRSYLIGHRPAD